ncbi:MAG: UDP-N-acetylglucosamine 2-epimerase (non-hydrolyzing) [Haloferacaceae archaeon]
MKVVSVVGARPQFVKAFPVSNELREDHEEVLVHTGQHYDRELSGIFFEELRMPTPEYNLGVGSDTPGAQVAEMIRSLEPVLREEAPDVVVVYGDTNSTLSAAIAATKADPLLAHVEAGLRSDNREMPEETNRVLTDHASDLLFAPTRRAVENLSREGLDDRASWTGDVMYDALRAVKPVALETSTIRSDLSLEDPYVLATVHRAGNTDDPDRLGRIVDALVSLPEPVVFPIHPRTVSALEGLGELDRLREAVELLDPVGYFDFVALLDGARRLVTDSGGAQKEAFLLDTPCVTLRAETEWTETVDAGWNVLVDADPERIRAAVRRDFDPGEKPLPYGDGNAAAAIRRQLVDAVSR